MFEETLLGGTDLVELIDVDKREAIEVKLGILLSWKINAVRIIGTYGRRDDAATESRFAATLFANQQRRDIIGIFGIRSTPVDYHIEKPAMKQFHPMRIVAGHGSCQSPDAVFAIPDGEVVKKIFQRIEHRYAVWVNISADIPVP